MNKLVSAILLLLLINNCSHLQVSKNPTQTISKICLNSEGKGRITTSRGKIIFSYSTLWQPKDKTYIVEIQPTFQNTESLLIDFKNDKSHSFRGSLVNLVVGKLGNDYSLKNKLIQVLNLYAWLIKANKLKNKKTREEYITSCLDKGCFKAQNQFFKSYKLYSVLNVQYPGQQVSVQFKKETKKSVEHVVVTSEDKSGESFQLEMLQSSCRDES